MVTSKEPLHLREGTPVPSREQGPGRQPMDDEVLDEQPEESTLDVGPPEFPYVERPYHPFAPASVRAVLFYGFGIVVAVVLLWALHKAQTWEETMQIVDQIRDILVALVGGAVGYYFRKGQER